MDNLEKKYCTECGHENNEMARYCTSCGHPFEDVVEYENNSLKSESIGEVTSAKINAWTGGEGAVEVSLASFFSQVFKHHTESEAEEIFSAGTDSTTPTLNEVADENVNPWLFSRVFLFNLLIAGLMLVLLSFNERNGIYVIYGTFVSIAVPIMMFVLFFECNVFKNISMYQAIKLMMYGGALSLIVTVIVSSFFESSTDFDLKNALSIGFSEELGKAIVAAYFINTFRAKNIFNGLLIGGSIGAGFQAFENIMYMFSDYTGSIQLDVPWLRMISGISSHAVWCAISAAGLIMAANGHKISIGEYFDVKFMRFFIFVIALHGLWDWRVTHELLGIIPASLIFSFVSLFVLIIVIQAGLREVSQLKNQKY